VVTGSIGSISDLKLKPIPEMPWRCLADAWKTEDAWKMPGKLEEYRKSHT
jgi:hypothetical protein